MVVPEKVAVIELLFPSILRAVISLHPAGSTDPDAVAFFSPDEFRDAYRVLGTRPSLTKPGNCNAIVLKNNILNNYPEPVEYGLQRLVKEKTQ
ncbi:mediator of RNA polymerase II transcription subunit 27-like [Trifolium medium]|uniref:Mediator of RNA polymerase II transcription subunit 27-like n=1 Tax=Trifolium medium TaxID=97028 RepID=A0A392QSV9_9FABA|nr:mediator of RNA polymerase II transcription subunit 27-like [Trifolium medium]